VSSCETPITLIELLGLRWVPAFYRDRVFLLALAGGPLFGILLVFATLVNPLSWARVWSFPFLSAVLWQPIVEELLFRGLIQGQLGRLSWARHSFLGVTPANAVASMLFMAAHWLTHPPLWAIAVLVPSLVFGAMRDRFRSLYPAIVLHSFYNAGYFLLTGLP